MEGSSDCPCVFTEDVLAVAPNNCTIITYLGYMKTSEPCISTKYGSTVCTSHDLNEPHIFGCEGGEDGENRPRFCSQPWCYVDYEKCRRSDYAMHKSDLFPNLYYSYETCDASANFYSDHNTISGLKGSNISVVIPGSFFPYHYKLNSDGDIAAYDGDEYYDDNIPYQGSVIDYLHELKKLTGLNNFELTFRSGKQGSGFSSSSYTTSVLDVQRGVVDMAASVFSMTSNRLLKTTFTTPLIVDPNMLFVPRPMVDNSLLTRAKTTLAPFSMNLWLLLCLCFIIVGSLQVWYANEKGKYGKWRKQFQTEKFRNGSWLQKYAMVMCAISEGVWIAFIDFFGAATAPDLHDPLPQKVIQFGTGFLILVAIAAYTANLGKISFFSDQCVFLILRSHESQQMFSCVFGQTSGWFLPQFC